eukprot:Skav216088  [mRNA]  locus=scaffold2042:100720:108127:+ [translate_table: standard]
MDYRPVLQTLFAIQASTQKSRPAAVRLDGISADAVMSSTSGREEKLPQIGSKSARGPRRTSEDSGVPLTARGVDMARHMG